MSSICLIWNDCAGSHPVGVAGKLAITELPVRHPSGVHRDYVVGVENGCRYG